MTRLPLLFGSLDPIGAGVRISTHALRTLIVPTLSAIGIRHSQDSGRLRALPSDRVHLLTVVSIREDSLSYPTYVPLRAISRVLTSVSVPTKG